MRRYRILIALLAAAMVLGVATPALAGNVDKPRPFHGIIVGSADFVEPTIECEVGVPSAGAGTGHTNYFGDYTWHFEWCLVLTGPDTVEVDVAFLTATAANGDVLYGTFTAEGVLAPDGSPPNTQELTYEGGTGRFERAVGSASGVGLIYPDKSSYNTFEGTLAFDASDRSG